MDGRGEWIDTHPIEMYAAIMDAFPRVRELILSRVRTGVTVRRNHSRPDVCLQSHLMSHKSFGPRLTNS